MTTCPECERSFGPRYAGPCDHGPNAPPPPPRRRMTYAAAGHVLVLDAQARILDQIPDPMPTGTDFDDPVAFAADEAKAALAWAAITARFPTATMLAMMVMTAPSEEISSNHNDEGKL